MNKFKQMGSTLIVVLILLVIISVIGLYAIRQSLFSLKLATNAQVQTMLMQTSDVALSHLERNFNESEANNHNMALTPVGQVLLGGNEGKELQFCFKPTEVSGTAVKNNFFFNLSDFRIIERASATTKKAKSTAEAGNYNAFCDPATMFSISRKALVTQVAVINPEDPAAELNRFDLTTQETDLKDAQNTETRRVRVIVTTLAPALSSASLTDISACLKEHLMDDLSLRNREDGLSPDQVKVETVQDCLSQLGVPVNSQFAEYRVNLSESKGI